ncbi:MAG: potassium-transporting ATPase subunit KdpA [Thermoplasmata archaeon]|nr:potassium-transporting ATPase subunit KdpA [Thermoplasmata archaeon]
MIPVGSLPEVVLTIVLAVAIAPFFGHYLANVYTGRYSRWDAIALPIESRLFWLLGVNPRRPMGWKEYARALILTDAFAILAAFILFQVQAGLPWNALGAPNMSWHLAFHTASSFGTNTDFQHYSPELQVSLFAALFGEGILMFLSPATGICAFIAFARGFSRKDGRLGNYYSDLVRTYTRVLIPVATLGAVVFALLSVPQTFSQSVSTLPLGGGSGVIPLGPVASWNSIEFLGTNGGGYFAANAAHPFQNPSALTNFAAIILMFLIPLASPFAFARIVRRPHEVWPLIGTVLIVFLIGFVMFVTFEGSNPYLPSAVDQSHGYLYGAETRFTISESSLFQFTSVYTNTGSTSMSLGSLTPLAQSTLLFAMFLQSAPGGDGAGFGMLLIYVVLAVFMGGLMVGRSPEYLGKKIGMSQVKWAAAALLSHPFVILVPVALAFWSGLGQTAVGGYSPHGFTVLLYEFTSEAANNGSGMGPINDNTVFFNVAGALVMLIGRYFPMIAMLAIAGSLSQEEIRAPGPGTLKTETLTFTVFLTIFLIILAGLLFLPVLMLGPFSQIVGGL